MMRASRRRVRMMPFITPTNGPWWPKSVVMVMTPEGAGAFMARALLRSGARRAPRGAAPGLRAGAAAVGIRHRRESLGLDVLAARRAAGVAPARQAPQRRLHLLQLALRRARDRPQHVIVLALRHLFGEVRRQGIGLMAQIGAGIVGALAQFVPTFEQPLAHCIRIHVSPPAKKSSLQEGR